MKKKILISLMSIAFCFALLGCGKEESLSNDANDNNSGNNNQQQETIPNSNLNVGKYKVEKGNNSISVITNDGSGISTTTYYFTNDIISRAELIEEFSTESIAEVSYNTMKNEASIMNSYNDIKLDGKKVILTVKSEILSAYNTLGYDEFYDLMYSTYEAYID